MNVTAGRTTRHQGSPLYETRGVVYLGRGDVSVGSIMDV